MVNHDPSPNELVFGTTPIHAGAPVALSALVSVVTGPLHAQTVPTARSLPAQTGALTPAPAATAVPADSADRSADGADCRHVDRVQKRQ